MKSLEQLRDELAEQYAATHSVFTVELFSNIVEDYKAGFNAAVQAIQEREKNARVFYIAGGPIQKPLEKRMIMEGGYDPALDLKGRFIKVREVIE